MAFFLHELEICFVPSMYEDPKGMLLTLSQTTTIKDNQTKFEMLVSTIFACNRCFTSIFSFSVSNLRYDTRCNHLSYLPCSSYEKLRIWCFFNPKQATPIQPNNSSIKVKHHLMSHYQEVSVDVWVTFTTQTLNLTHLVGHYRHPRYKFPIISHDYIWCMQLSVHVC